MSKTFQLKRFGNVGLLRRLDFELLVQLLRPNACFLNGRSDFIWTEVQEEFSFENLSKAMLSLDSNTPEDFLKSLYFIEWFSDDQYFDALLQIATDREIVPTCEEVTVEDLALRIWLEFPDVMEGLHAEIHRLDKKSRTKRFESFFSTSPSPLPLEIPDQAVIEALQNDLAFWAFIDTGKREGITAIEPQFPSVAPLAENVVRQLFLNRRDRYALAKAAQRTGAVCRIELATVPDESEKGRFAARQFESGSRSTGIRQMQTLPGQRRVVRR